MHTTPPPPFACQYSPQLPELLLQLNCSIALSTYQAGKLVFISPLDEHKLTQLPRTFDKPMGIAFDETSNRMALACREEVKVFQNSAELAIHYPKAPGKYDAMFVPRVTYHTGPIDMHDLSFGETRKELEAREAAGISFSPSTETNGLFAVNTMFNSIVEIDDKYSFRPIWMPPQFDRLVGQDCCHLNGMAMVNGRPKYATAFGVGREYGSWRETLLTSGVLYDIESNEIIADGLGMPHSPRIFSQDPQGLYVLTSATGELVRIDIGDGSKQVISSIGGFVRGMDRVGDYLFVGLSKLRENSSTFAKLPFAKQANRSGIIVLHIPTMARVGELIYQASVDEIYDVHILQNMLRPNVINLQKPEDRTGISTPQTTFWGLSKS